jgi:hypothetical protein
MTWNLINLIRSSGRAGVKDQSFHGHVTGAEVGAAMTEYLISSFTFSGRVHPGAVAGVPQPNQGAPYGPSTLFSFTADFVRGSRAFNIQNNFPGAYLIEGVADVAGLAEITMEGLAVVGLGAQHELLMRVRAPIGGLANVEPWSELVLDPQSGLPAQGADAQAMRFRANFSTDGSGGVTTISVFLEYMPDMHLYNPSLNNGDGWEGEFTLRAHEEADFDFAWYRVMWDGASWVRVGGVFQTARSITGGRDCYFDHNRAPAPSPDYDFGAPPGGFGAVWLEWRLKGQPTWNVIGPVVQNDARLPM